MGYSVAISGNMIATGDLVHFPPLVYVFVKRGDRWVSSTRAFELAAAGIGSTVAISGNTIVAGAPEVQVGSNPGGGTVFVFTEPPDGWPTASLERGHYVFASAQLSASDGKPDDLFGQSVAVSGSTIVVGAPGHNAVYVFMEPRSGWRTATQSAELTASDGGGELGSAVAVSGNTIVAGAPTRSFGQGAAQGAVYVFTEPGSGWRNATQSGEATASDGASFEYLAGEGPNSVAVSGTTIVAGAPYHVVRNVARGAAYVFTAFPGHVYWTNNSAFIGRASIGLGARAGTFTARGVTSSFIQLQHAGASGVAVDDEFIYWGEPGLGEYSSSIGRATINGGQVDQHFIPHLAGAVAVAVDSGHVYWAAGPNSPWIGRADLDGTHIQQHFIYDPYYANALAVNSDYIYWTNQLSSGASNWIGRATIERWVARSNVHPRRQAP